MPTQRDAVDNGNIHVAMSACACICSLYYNKHHKHWTVFKSLSASPNNSLSLLCKL